MRKGKSNLFIQIVYLLKRIKDMTVAVFRVHLILYFCFANSNNIVKGRSRKLAGELKIKKNKSTNVLKNINRIFKTLIK